MLRKPPVSLTSLALLAALAAAACAKGEESGAAAGDTARVSGEAGGSAPAGASSADADLADLSRYRLTMDKVDRYFAAQRNLGQKVKDMSPAEREALAKSQDTDADADLDDMVRKIEQSPVYRDAVRDAGLSPREFVMVTMAMFQAGMAAGIVKMRPNDDQDSLAREMKVNPENIKFMQQHEAEITRKQKALEEEMKRMGITDG